ncbi:MAG: F0F1 ATP synthase subunit delta [Lachnospiraceae bacterium]
MAKLVSKTYGDALYHLALEENKLDEFLEEVTQIMGILSQNQELSRLMDHPKIVKEEKVKIIKEIFSESVSQELVGLMVMTVQKDRFGQMNEIFDYFITQVKEHKNIGTAKVTSAMPLSEEQKNQIRAKLLGTTKYVEFEIEYDVDKELIGGMVIRIGDRVVDSSVKARLYRLSKELTKIQLKAGECAP